MSPPAVTVLLPAYNAQQWLREAVDSMLRQTMKGFELLVVDDGSTDATARILQSYSDKRLHVVTHQTNQGLIASLNRGIEHATGEFVARMDADDISHPRRLELQLNYLRAHPEVGVCGTWFHVRRGIRRTTVRIPCDHEAISARLFFRSPFGHPTVMMRKALFQREGLFYDPLANHAEDFDLWVRARSRTRFANLPRALLDYRVHAGQVSSRHLQPQSEAASRVRLKQLAMLLPRASTSQADLHLRVCDGHLFHSALELSSARTWLDTLQEANRKAHVFTDEAFGDALAHAWSHCCLRADVAPGRLIAAHLSRDYSGLSAERWRERLHVAARALLPRPAG